VFDAVYKLIFYTTEAATIAELDKDSDDKLFRNIQFNENHVL